MSSPTGADPEAASLSACGLRVEMRSASVATEFMQRVRVTMADGEAFFDIPAYHNGRGVVMPCGACEITLEGPCRLLAVHYRMPKVLQMYGAPEWLSARVEEVTVRSGDTLHLVFDQPLVELDAEGTPMSTDDELARWLASVERRRFSSRR